MTQFFIVFTMYFMGMLVAMFLLKVMAKAIWGIDMEELETMPHDMLRIFIVVTPFLAFITPATIFRRYMEFDGQDYLKTKKAPTLKTTGIVIMIFILCFPVSNFLHYLNSLINFGEAISQGEEMEEIRNIQYFIEPEFWKFLTNLLGVGLLASIGEELIYRSIVQRLFTKITRNPHLAVLFSALIFSALHMSFSGFIPRFFMGLALAYVYLATANVWYCVVFHFLNNAISVTLLWLASRGYDLSDINMFGFYGMGRWVGLALLVILTVFALTQMNKLIRKDFVEEMKEY